MLRGVGVTMSLPFLEAMLPSKLFGAAAPTTGPSALAADGFPKRLAFVYMPNGTIPTKWNVTGTGADYVLSPTLQPLASLRDDLLVLDGLACNHAMSNGDGPGDHARAMSAFLTAVQPHKTGGTDIRAGISLDQYAATKIGNTTRFASLELALEYGRQEGECDSGYACTYSNNLSWRTQTTPAPHEVNPRVLFDRLFGGAGERQMSDTDAQREMYDQSILDFVMDDAQTLNNKLGANDKRRMDEYMTSVRDVERRLSQPTVPIPANIAGGMQRPTRIPESFVDHFKLMADLLVIAFQADLTRISSLVLGVEGSRRSYPEIGIMDEHHAISHHKNIPSRMAQQASIGHFHIQQFAYFLNRLKSIKEGNGTLLDHSMVLYGGGCKEGNIHSHFDLPVLLAGKGGGTLTPGRQLHFETMTPIANLYVSMLNRVGIPAKSFGDSTGPLEGLSA
jgi:hypothetical protein